MELGAAFTALAGLLGVFVGAWANKLGERQVMREERELRIATEMREQKQELTRELFFKWEEIPNLIARIEADKIILDRAFLSMDYQGLAVTVKSDKWVSLSRIFHFVETLGDLIAQNQIDIELYRSLFRRDVSYWAPKLLERLDDDNTRAVAIRRALDAL
jgi:hypothetical protein